MFPDAETNCVYISDLLPGRCPTEYAGLIRILKRHGIPVIPVGNTKDIWCRDYLPVQVDRDTFIQFTYNPDYLRPNKYRHLITGPEAGAAIPGMKRLVRSDIILDGGNVVRWRHKAIMTEKVFQENEGMPRDVLERQIRELLQLDSLIIIPVEPGDDIGHSDGMVRFVDEHKVLVNDYSGSDARFGRRLCATLEKAGLTFIRVPYSCTANDTRDGIASALGNYINYLHVKNVIVIPAYKDERDDESMAIIQKAFPSGVANSIDCSELSGEGGVLNCIAWNIAV